MDVYPRDRKNHTRIWDVVDDHGDEPANQPTPPGTHVPPLTYPPAKERGRP